MKEQSDDPIERFGQSAQRFRAALADSDPPLRERFDRALTGLAQQIDDAGSGKRVAPGSIVSMLDFALAAIGNWSPISNPTSTTSPGGGATTQQNVTHATCPKCSNAIDLVG